MNDLERMVLRQIGEDADSPDVFTEGSEALSDVRRSINDAVQEVSMITGAIVNTYLIPLVADNTFYRLWPKQDHFGWVTSAWLVNRQRRLVQTDRYRMEAEDPVWMKRRGFPEYYFPVGLHSIGVYPAPSASGDVIELRCAMIPAAYTRDTERVRLRDDYHRAVVYLAVSEYYASRGAAPEATSHLQRYANAAGLAKQYLTAPEKRRWFETHKADNGQNSQGGYL